MALQDHGLLVLVSLGGWLADQHITRLVDFCLKTVALAPVLEVFNHLFFTFGRTGNFVYFSKLFKYRSRF